MTRSNIPLKARLTGSQYRLVPTGDATIDTPAFSTLVDVIVNSNKPGVIEIADNALALKLDASLPGFSLGKVIGGSVRIKGETPYATIQQENGFCINWGGYINNLIPTTSLTGLSYFTRGSFDGVVAKETDVVVTNSGWLQSAGIAVGDVITLSSLDEIAGADAHLSGGANHPGEIHRVTKVTHDTTVVSSVTVPRTTLRLDSPVVDSMTVSPQLCKVSMLRNCGFHDLTLTSTLGPNSPNHNQTTAFSIRRCQGFIWENVYAQKMPGTVAFDLCLDPVCSGHRAEDVPDPQGDYGFIFSAVQNYRVSDSIWYNVRHATTSGGQTVPASATQYANHVWGTPAHGVIDNCRLYIMGQTGVSWAGFDTHSGGHDILHRNCDVFVSHKGATVEAFTARCRRAKFHRCRVFGNKDDNVMGFVIRGAESEVRECDVEASWMGVVYKAGFRGNSYSTHRCDENRFTDLFGAGVRVQDAVGSVNISRNICENVRRGAASGGYRKTCVDLVTTGTGHTLTGNHVNYEHASDESINTGTMTTSQVKVYGNYMLGYGSGSMGEHSDVAPGTTIATAYAAKNYTD